MNTCHSTANDKRQICQVQVLNDEGEWDTIVTHITWGNSGDQLLATVLKGYSWEHKRWMDRYLSLPHK